MDSNLNFNVPSGFKLIENKSDFGNLIGPIYYKNLNNTEVFGFRSQEKHINLGGYVHGGMLSSFADIVMGQFANRNYDFLTVTINMSIDFISLAKKNEWITGSSKLIKKDKKFVFLEVAIESNKKTILYGTGVFKIIKLKYKTKEIT
ncbi:MAG: hypothetical protein CFH01_00317 [Alphaproteobacteria bacterium MarineAlpha2_Bin1]|nr:MAG: hypothetical protein CFH01_00317 [Alphaproteobacteria bacterium MarineAlpha2_Bin1]|tara:strand:+ start:1159 stop:1599 length:441 start_codon:yes stop_codon:yes gene_type:complete